MKKLYVAVPTAGMVCLEFHRSVYNMIGYMTTNPDIPPVQMCMDFAMGSNWIANRELIAKNACDKGATHLVFLDDDMEFDPDILVGMLNRDLDIVMTNYLVKEWPPKTWVAIDRDGKRLRTTKEKSGVEEVLGSGFGVSVISTEVFKKTPQPWFLPVWSSETGEYSTEDMPFCHRTRQAGFKVYVDHDASKKVAHMGKFRWRWDMPEAEG